MGCISPAIRNHRGPVPGHVPLLQMTDFSSCPVRDEVRHNRLNSHRRKYYGQVGARTESEQGLDVKECCTLREGNQLDRTIEQIGRQLLSFGVFAPPFLKQKPPLRGILGQVKWTGYRTTRSNMKIIENPLGG